jgi:hypothetical protein
VGARATGTRGGPGAAPSREAGAEAAGTRDSPGATLPFVLTWNLYAGVPGLKGTDSVSYPAAPHLIRWHDFL